MSSPETTGQRRREYPPWMVKNILSEEELHKWMEQIRRKYRVVMVSGVFDLFHVGHLAFLQTVAEFGRGRILARVAGDGYASQFKGDGRPVNSEIDRALVVAGCRVVDKVFIDRSVIDPKDVEANARRLTEIGPDMIAIEIDDPNLEAKLKAVNMAGIEHFLVTPPEIESTTGIIARVRKP